MDGLHQDPAEPDGTGGASAGDGDRKRDSLFLAATLRLRDGRPRQVRLRNLSEGGVMIETADRVAIGEAVGLSLRGVGEVSGVVAWCTNGRVGVSFDQPIDPRRARKPVGHPRRLSIAAPRR